MEPFLQDLPTSGQRWLPNPTMIAVKVPCMAGYQESARWILRPPPGGSASMDGVVASDPSLTNWLLILGAGASVPPPTELPTFADLSAAFVGLVWELVTRPGGSTKREKSGRGDISGMARLCHQERKRRRARSRRPFLQLPERTFQRFRWSTPRALFTPGSWSAGDR
jgi:hypothetical protein